MARTDGKLHPRESARPTNCRGSGAFLTCTPRTYCSRKWLPVKAFLPLPLQRSCFELLAVDLPGPTGISPSQSSPIRSRDDPSSRHRISASFRNLLGSRTIIMRSVHRDFQRTNCLFGSAWRRRFRRLPQHGQSGWQLPLWRRMASKGTPYAVHEGKGAALPRFGTAVVKVRVIDLTPPLRCGFHVTQDVFQWERLKGKTCNGFGGQLSRGRRWHFSWRWWRGAPLLAL